MWFVFNTFPKCHIKYSCKPSILFILWSPTIVSTFWKKFIFLNFPKCHSDIFVCPSFFSEVFSSSGKWHATITVSQYSYLCKRSVSDHLFFFMAESHLFSSNSAVSLVVCFINDPLVPFLACLDHLLSSFFISQLLDLKAVWQWFLGTETGRHYAMKVVNKGVPALFASFQFFLKDIFAPHPP